MKLAVSPYVATRSNASFPAYYLSHKPGAEGRRSYGEVETYRWCKALPSILEAASCQSGGRRRWQLLGAVAGSPWTSPPPASAATCWTLPWRTSYLRWAHVKDTKSMCSWVEHTQSLFSFPSKSKIILLTVMSTSLITLEFEQKKIVKSKWSDKRW